ncbi:MAG: TonB-dependent receptor [Pseudomonadota bacterium]
MAQDNEAFALDPIVLTTRLREQSALDAPIAATVVDGAQTAPGRSDTLERAVRFAPNVFFNDQGGPLTIRGITSLGIDGGVDRQSAVGLYIDGVYVPRPFSYRDFTLDLDRIEIARGSQATLLGKNTIGGAVNLITPTPDGTGESALTFGVSDDGGALAQLTYETALSDRVAVRAAVQARRSDGYVTNTFNGDYVGDIDTLLGRITLAGELTDDTTFKFTADYNRDDSDGGLWFALIDDALDLEATHDFLPEAEVRNGGLSLRIDHDFGDFALTSITGWRAHELEIFLDGDFTGADQLGQGQIEDQTQFSQEFRLASTGDRPLDWLVGLYAFYEDFEAEQRFDLTSFPRSQWSAGLFDQQNTSLAAYGSVDWEFAPGWELSAGLRYTNDRKETRSEITSPSGTGFFGATGVATADQTFTAFSPELALSYAIDDQQRVYGRIARGFKSGGISPFLDPDGGANVYDPETTNSIELGYRFASADGRAFFGATVFATDWENQQVRVNVSPTIRLIENAAESRARGIELEGRYEATDGLWLGASYGYTDATYQSFRDPTTGAEYDGNRLVYTPEHTFSASVDWQQPVGNGLIFSTGLDLQYQSGFFFNPSNAFKQEATTIVDARIGLAGEIWSAELFVDNLTDERALTNYFDFGFAEFGVAAPGRTVGVNFTARF